eukprot:Hpha_TRINITY_DN9337_c0_g1::TRINITY_DN9337_c0_g1_i1::g.26049::m.26049/K04838/SCN5A; voltage-gated sodium channel type V alpha
MAATEDEPPPLEAPPACAQPEPGQPNPHVPAPHPFSPEHKPSVSAEDGGGEVQRESPPRPRSPTFAQDTHVDRENTGSEKPKKASFKWFAKDQPALLVNQNHTRELMETEDILTSYDLLQDKEDGGNNLLTAGGFDANMLGHSFDHDRTLQRCAEAPLLGRSFFVFGPESRFRGLCRDVMVNWKWRAFQTLVVWASSITLFVVPRRRHGQSLTSVQEAWRTFDWVVVSLFIIDILLGCIAWGAVSNNEGGNWNLAKLMSPRHETLGKGADLKNHTFLGGSAGNRYDALVIFCAMVCMPFDIFGVYALRLTRVLPHLLFPQVRSVRALFESFSRCSSLMVDNISVLAFFMLFFGICAVEFFAGGFAFQCAINDYEGQVDGVKRGSTSHTDWLVSDGYTRMVCSPGERSVFSSVGCFEDMVCVETGNEDPKWLSFDDLPSTLLVIFQVIQLENWSMLMFPLFRTRNWFFAFVFFLLMIVLCKFIIINLSFAIIVLYFDYTRKSMDEVDPDAVDDSHFLGPALSDSIRAVMGCLPAAPRRCLERSFAGVLRPKGDAHMKEDEREMEEEGQGANYAGVDDTRADASTPALAGDAVEMMEKDEDKIESDSTVFAVENHPWTDRWWKAFDTAVFVVLVTNVAVQATESANQSATHERFLEISEFVFLGWYLFEQVVRIVFEHHVFAVTLHYWFDLLGFVLSVPPAFGYGGRLSIVSRLRVFRVLMLSAQIREFAQKFRFEPVLSVVYMLISMMLIFAAIGIQIFDGLYDLPDPDGRWDWMPEEWLGKFHFDTLGSAMLTLFLVMAGDNWSLPMYQAMGVPGMFVPSLVFYIIFFILSNWVLLSMFVAVLLEEFDNVAGGSLLERNVNNHELITRSRELFSQFLRHVDMNAAADDVDEETVAGVCAVVNMHKWASRAKVSKEKRTRRIARIQTRHAGGGRAADLEDSAQILQGVRIAKTLQGLRSRLAVEKDAEEARPRSAKGVNRILAVSQQTRQNRMVNLLRVAEKAQRSVELNVEREQSILEAEAQEMSGEGKQRIEGLLKGETDVKKLRAAATLFKVTEKKKFVPDSLVPTDDEDDSDFDEGVDDDCDDEEETAIDKVLTKVGESFTAVGLRAARLLGAKPAAPEPGPAHPPASPGVPEGGSRPVSPGSDGPGSPPTSEKPRDQSFKSEESSPPPLNAIRIVSGTTINSEREEKADNDSRRKTTPGTDDEDAVHEALNHILEVQATAQTQHLSCRKKTLRRRLKAKSLFVFAEDSLLRKKAVLICENLYFQRAVLAAVVASSILLIFARPAEAWGDTSLDMLDDTTVALGNTTQEILDILFLVIFSLEFLVKVVAYGFIWMSYKKPEIGAPRRKPPLPYMWEAWNVLDFLILVGMYFSYILQKTSGGSGFSAVRVFRVLRVIRVLRRVDSLRRILAALLAHETLMSTLLVLALALFFYLSFGIMAVHLLKGKLAACTDDTRLLEFGPNGCSTGSAYADVILRAVDAPETYANSSAYTWTPAKPEYLSRVAEEPGYLVPSVWTVPRRNFNDIGSSMTTLITIASGEDWGSPMLNAVADLGWAASAFFIVFMILTSFIVVNMVIFVITGAIRSQSGTANMVPEQIEWADLMHHLRLLHPLAWIPPPEVDMSTGQLTRYGKVRKFLLRFAGPAYLNPSPWFDIFVNAVILVNIALMATEYREDLMSPEHKSLLENANYAIVAIYVVECIVRQVALTPRTYFSDSWNRFDFVIVVASVMAVISHLATSSQGNTQVGGTAKLFSIIRIFRILRIFKLVRRFKGVAFLFSSLLSSIPAIMNIMLIVVLFIWVWGALGTELMGNIRFQSSVSKNVNFRSFFHAFSTLTLVITLDDWINIFFESQLHSPECSTLPPQWVGEADGGPAIDLSFGFNDCGRPAFAMFFFISFFVLGAYIFLNLVTAAILDEVQHTISREQCRVTEVELEEFQLVWMNTVQGTSREMPRWRLQHLMEGLYFRNKLGVHPCFHKKFYSTFALKLDFHKLQVVSKSRHMSIRRQSRKASAAGSPAANLGLRCTAAQVAAAKQASEIWPPPVWPSFRFSEVLHILCHNSYENVPLSMEDVERDEMFQKKIGRLLATQVLQSVIRCLVTIHQVDTGRIEGIRGERAFTDEDRRRLKQTRMRIREWKAINKNLRDREGGFAAAKEPPPKPSPELLAALRAPPNPVPERIIRSINPNAGFSRLFRLPRKIKKVVEEDMESYSDHHSRRATEALF